LPYVQRRGFVSKGRCVVDDRSPWSKVPAQTEDEEELWELQRELRALQNNINRIGEGYPSYRHPRKNIPVFEALQIGSEEEMIKLLDDILDGNI
jgi:hypothetical protein